MLPADIYVIFSIETPIEPHFVFQIPLSLLNELHSHVIFFYFLVLLVHVIFSFFYKAIYGVF